MSHLIISKKNEVYLEIESEPHIYYELRDQFQFEVPNAKFSPAYKNKWWDGKIFMFSINTRQIYIGLLDRVISFCKNRDYTYEFRENKFYGLPFEINENVSEEGVKDYVRSITNLQARDYQIKGIYECLRFNRKVILSPTGSGKSLMIYSLVRYYHAKQNNILIIVPTVSLVTQMYKDFLSYGWNAEDDCHLIYSGHEKDSDKQVFISTWQSLHKMPQKYFSKFDCVICDEVHLARAKSISSIATKLCDAKYRFGFTGTLDGIEVHKWVLEGLFGPSYKIIRTDELMKQGHLSQLNIQCILLKHQEKKFDTYEDEIKYLISHEKRNKFITNLSLKLKGNTLILFSRVETHGAILYEKINNNSNGRKVFFVHGGVNAEERELVREITERENNAIIVASYGVFSTGVNIKNLHNLIFASPSKSRIRNLQSIGRILRTNSNKNKAVLYDIADDCSSNSKKNYTLNHFIERVKIYNEENFKYDIVNLELSKQEDN
jgi:superfamily II DNA or RNA helicase